MTRDEIIDESRAEGGMFIVIPSVVKLDEALPLSAQMLYGIITWKCNRYAYTWATNRELGKALGVSAKRVSTLLTLLERQGHIETAICYREGTKEVLHRYVYPIMKSARPLAKERPLPEKRVSPPCGQGYPGLEPGRAPPENWEVIGNIKEQKESIKNTPYSPPPGDAPAPESESADKPAPEAKRKTKRPRAKRSVPVYAPDRFEQFWQAYPGGGSRLKAVSAWDALAPSDGLIDEMALALKRQLASRQWRDGVGIPHASTWLNQRRWTDKLPEAPSQEGADGWMPDPEVTR